MSLLGEEGYPKSNKEDLVNQPKHYCSHPSGIECIQIAELLPFNLGNALKYLWRSDLKWDKQEDTKKAIFYLRRQAESGKQVKLSVSEFIQLERNLKSIKAVDLELWNICDIIIFGSFNNWLSLANKLEATQ